jgi:hypothetical protein
LLLARALAEPKMMFAMYEALMMGHRLIGWASRGGQKIPSPLPSFRRDAFENSPARGYLCVIAEN